MREKVPSLFCNTARTIEKRGKLQKTMEKKQKRMKKENEERKKEVKKIPLAPEKSLSLQLPEQIQK